MGSVFLTCSTPWLSLSAVWFVLGVTHGGSTADAGLDAAARGLRAERAADGGVLYVRMPSICRHVQRQLMRNELARLYRMITTSAPLLEKTCLFWHSIFATDYIYCMPANDSSSVLSYQ